MSEISFLDEERESKVDLSQLEQLAARLLEVANIIKDCESKLSEVEETLAKFKQRSNIEKHFYELAGLPYEDKSAQLEEQVKMLKSQHENACSEREKLRGEIFRGLSTVSIPLERIESAKLTEDAVVLPFRDGRQYHAIISFIKSELKFGCSPIYVAISNDGVKVLGVNDELSAMKELVSAMESLKARAKEKLGQALKPEVETEELTSEKPYRGKFRIR